MKAIKILPIVMLFCNLNLNAYAQDDTKIREQVLNKRIIGKEFLFKQDDNNVTKLKYLGSINTKKGETLQFLTSIFLFGVFEDSKRASCRILVYNDRNKYLGNYYVGGTWYLPERLEGKKLIFLPHEECNQTTSISFANGIRRKIYILCTKAGGDVFMFSNE